MLNHIQISTKDLRDNLAEILEKVAIGKQSFIVSKFGRQKAIITPVKTNKRLTKVDFRKLSAYGMWKGRRDMEDVDKWVRNLREKEGARSMVHVK